jgi:hypothetical protein
LQLRSKKKAAEKQLISSRRAADEQPRRSRLAADEQLVKKAESGRTTALGFFLERAHCIILPKLPVHLFCGGALIKQPTFGVAMVRQPFWRLKNSV